MTLYILNLPNQKNADNLRNTQPQFSRMRAGDRCWNYSIHVGESTAHPLLCERCVSALAGTF
ncbi:hypothetical protein IQ278_20015 [Tolypothrix sp. LEGE 11397]|uniref:zinc finger domain-containing protein n=1 Tax=unclassified Tolypothrix TaxID=2649714 RepID=UPI0005EAB640|nr:MULTISPECIES: zinc finger domain-containing protein [unclassified Tolypothrix]EKF02266.1 zinc finger found in FPG and IleRS [Tolypothrix sp. PCC 7601]MBE9084395.1 hypothetical protein [Tolypothrix sp. LEGE 11397]UYD29050.1 hypothetical protein HGR01_14040 [Tolypothrix sp. PCC 7712]UYD35036.1 hypothetical protein HG267_04300 [Tolypothrix sp. PCC 7601]